MALKEQQRGWPWPGDHHGPAGVKIFNSSRREGPALPAVGARPEQGCGEGGSCDVA